MKKKGYPSLLNVNRVPSQPKKRRKITLVYDEEKRREFLGGFHKRKVQRRQKAQEDLKQKLKEERKRIKREAREHYKTSLSNREIPELEKLLSQHEYETEGHTVSILELNVADLGDNDKFIGENRVTYEKDEDEDELDDNGQESANNDIEGMELNNKSNLKKPKIEAKNINCKKDLKRAMKRTTLKQMQKSKVYQRKQRLDRVKNRNQAKSKLRIEQKQNKSCKKRRNGMKDKKLKKGSYD